MNTYHSFLNELINENHTVFRKYEELKWLNPYEAIDQEEKRDELLASYSEKVNYLFNETKPYINRISPGCKLCGEGEWSCLFITGRCNAKCFYCPAPQDSDDLPTAQKLEFSDPMKYVEFINHFGFKGCSFSGGEPLLVFDRTLHFLQTIRKHCSPDLYIWMYTNGILADEAKFKALAEAGINEVRFDIGATDYHLKGLRKASGLIPNLTVEIPAVPEEVDRMKEIIPQLIDAGVTNLNLHQLRLTSHNVTKLSQHAYTYLHGEHPTVLESELAALEIIRFVDENKLDIGVNYCNFQYKNRFQKAGYRSKVASRVTTGSETVTENGFVRRLFVPVNSEVPALANSFVQTPEQFKQVSFDEFKQASGQIPFVVVDYTGIILHHQQNHQPLFEYLNIGTDRYPFERGKPCNPVVIKNDRFDELIQLMEEETNVPPEAFDLFTVWKHEKIEYGRRNYF